MLSYKLFVESAEKNGWIDHQGKFRPNFKTHYYPDGRPVGRPVNRGHARSAARYFGKGNPNHKDPGEYFKHVDHALNHGWTRVYHDGEMGVAEYKGSKVKSDHKKHLDAFHSKHGGEFVRNDLDKNDGVSRSPYDKKRR